jgi:hypothetical protein
MGTASSTPDRYSCKRQLNLRLVANAAVAQSLVERRRGGVRAENEQDGPGALSRMTGHASLDCPYKGG